MEIGIRVLEEIEESGARGAGQSPYKAVVEHYIEVVEDEIACSLAATQQSHDTTEAQEREMEVRYEHRQKLSRLLQQFGASEEAIARLNEQIRSSI